MGRWEHLYLEPEVAFAAIQRQGRDAGDTLSVTGRTLNKRLHERGLLASTDPPHLTVRRVLQSKRRRVLHLPVAALSPKGGTWAKWATAARTASAST